MTSSFELPPGLPTCLGEGDDGFRRLCELVELETRSAKNGFVATPFVKAELKRIGFSGPAGGRSAERLRRKIIAFYRSPSIRSSAWREELGHPEVRKSLEALALRDYMPSIFDEPIDKDGLQACTQFFDPATGRDTWRKPALAALPSVRRDLEDWSDASDDRRQVIALAAFAVATVLDDVRLLRWAAGACDELAEQFKFATCGNASRLGPDTEDAGASESGGASGMARDDARSALHAACEELIKAADGLKGATPSATLFDSISEGAAKIAALRDAVLAAEDSERRRALIDEVLGIIESQPELMEHLGEQHANVRAFWERAYESGQKPVEALQNDVDRIRTGVPAVLEDLARVAAEIVEAERAVATSGIRKSEAHRMAANAHARREALSDAVLEIVLPVGYELRPGDATESLTEVPTAKVDDSLQPDGQVAPRPTGDTTKSLTDSATTKGGSEASTGAATSVATGVSGSMPKDPAPSENRSERAPESLEEENVSTEPSGAGLGESVPGADENANLGAQPKSTTTTGEGVNAPPTPAEPEGQQRGLSEAVWLAVGDSHLGIAYHITRLMPKSDDGAPFPTSSLIAASALGRRISQPKDKITEHYQKAIEAAEELQQLESGSSAAIQILFLDATLRAALFAPTTTALDVLQRLQLSDSFASIGSFASRWAQRCERLHATPTSLDVRQISVTFQNADREAEIQKLKVTIRNQLRDGNSYRPAFVPAARIWKHWLRDGLIRDVEKLFSEKAKTRSDDVRSIVERYDNPKSFEDLIRVTNNRLQKGPRSKLDARTVEHIRCGLSSLMDNLRSWLRLVEGVQQDRAGFVGRTLRELHMDIVNAIGEIQSATESSRTDNTALPVRSALKRVLQTTRGLLAVFDGIETSITNTETSIEAILSRDLLLVPSLVLDPQYQILNNDEEALAILARPEAASVGPKKSFEARLAANDLVGAYLLNEWLLELGGTIEADCSETLEQALDEQWEKSEATRKHLVEQVEQAYFRDQIDPETRDSLATLVTGPISKDLRLVLDAQVRCALVSDELVKCRETSVRLMRQQFENLDRELSAAEQRERDSALEDGDLVAARELIGRLQKGEDIVEPEKEQNRLRHFLDSVREIEVSMSGTDRPTLETIDRAAKERRIIGGLDFSSLTQSEMIVPSRLIEPWIRLTRRRSATRDDLKELLEGIGFDGVSVELKGHTAASMICNPLADRQLCPSHVYGSEARDRAPEPRGHYQILLSWPQPARPPRDPLIQLIDGAGAHVIVFHFEPLRDDRDELRRWSIHNHRRFIVIDETLLVYLSSVGKGRLCTFFECTLPFTCVDPFVTTASIVPPEMFYGRARERMEIMDPFGSCFVYGGRQLGKTALLRSAEAEFNRSSGRQLAKWIDLKHNEIGFARDAADIWSVLWRALQEIDVIPSEKQVPPGEGGLRDALGKSILDWIGESGRLLLLLDEADAFLTRDARTDFVESTRLKGIMEKSERRFKVVFSGLHNVLRTTERANHPLAHLGQAICVGPLLSNGEWRQAWNLVRQPLSAVGCNFKDQRSVLHVLAQTNYYPSLIQLFGAELVRHVRELRDFPYHLGVDDVASVFKRPEVRDAIRERFLLTLQLDDRYEVVAFAMAFEFAGDHGALAMGLHRDRILELAQQRWEDGFPTPENDMIGASNERMNFDVLLQELEGLGVLRRVYRDDDAGRFYTLRNPNILALLGTKLEIEETLDKDRRLPELFEADSFRDSYESGGGVRRRGMLTNEQEATLRDSPVSVIVGNAAARIDEVCDFLGRRTKASLRPLDDCLDANHFRRELTKSRPDRSERRVFLVPAECRWRVTWLHGAFEALKRMQRGRFVRVVFVADPSMLWTALKDLEDEAALGLERIEWLSAGPWDLTFLRHWCDVQDLTVDRGQIRDLLKISGGWPIVLERYEKSPSKKWDKRIQDLSQLVTDECDQFRQRLGIDSVAEEHLSELRKYEGLSGNAIEELGEYDSETLVTLKRRLSWAVHLRLVGLPEGTIEFNSLVGRVLRPEPDR